VFSRRVPPFFYARMRAKKDGGNVFFDAIEVIAK
jgi:hypothetical protein